MNATRNQLEYVLFKPDNPFTDIVESIWMVKIMLMKKGKLSSFLTGK
ncbi:hypothetical protein [Epilithonimonas arachidiradicis]|nr:hypothetical protein [Epilithonimonas arachidiradicis]